ncbi:MAG: methyltransferase domain-containing protein, partial [Myxococcota bacterium]
MNLDRVALEGVDIVADLESCSEQPLPLNDDAVDVVLASHVLEHIAQPLPLMEELWRIAKPGAWARFRTPYGSSDAAFEDPTHVRQYFLQSYSYFAQPTYWRAD